MNKKIIALSLTAALAAAGAGMSALADEPIKVLVNSQQINFPADEASPFIENDHTLVPMRAIFEALGAHVDWDGETRTVVSYDPVSDVSITLQIDSATMFVGETPIELETPARIVNDRTVVPVRAIAEGMNSIVDWDGNTRTVIVTKDITPKAAEEPAAQIANPWTDYESFDELKAAINGAYDFETLADSNVTPLAFRYLDSEKLSEVQYSYNADGKHAVVIVRKQPGDLGISGVSGGTKLEDYTSGNSLAQISVYDTYVYAEFSAEADTVYSNSVVISGSDLTQDETVTLIKSYIDEIAASYTK